MSAGKPINIKNPSHKPLPALPTENSNLDKLTIPTSPPTTPIQGSSDLPLDSISLGHIRRFLKQSLHNCAIVTDPWESVILGIILDISDIVPKAIEPLYQYIIAKNDAIISEKKIEKKIDNNIKQKNNDNNNDDETKDIKNIIKNDSKFVINLKKIEGGKPTDSHFVYNVYDGEHLFKFEDDEGLEPTKDAMRNWIGGTIILKGTKKYISRVDKVIELMVYVVCSLRLEMCLFKDHLVFRVDVKDGQDAEEIQNTLRSSRRSSKSSWLGWLMKHGNIPNIKEHVIKFHDKSEKHEKSEKHVSSLMRRVKRANSISKSSTTSTSTTINTEEDDDTINLNTSKFAGAIHKMDKTILSSSPGVKFPPPHLLMRLKEEETEIRLHTNVDGTFKSYFAKDALDLANNFSNGNDIISAKNSGNFTGKYRTYAAISRSNQISLDFQSGLTYLMTNNDSLNGVFKHQSLSCSYSRFWSSTSILPCDNHKIVTLEYYNKYNDHVDKCLGGMIDFLCEQAYEVCEDKTCDRHGIDHIITYTHNSGRISITLEESTDLNIESLSNNNNILMWTQCKLCSMKTPIVQMSHATYLYSFGKYLEILYYNEDFYCKDLCSHVELRDSFFRCFCRGNLVVKIEYEQVDLFEMRLPKLQISQEETPVFNTLGEAEGIDKLFIIDTEDAKRLLDEIRLEITYFYGAVKQHITALEEYFDSLPPNKESSSNGGVTKVNGNDVSGEEQDCFKMLNDMTNDFRKNEFDLYDILKKTNATVLNDVRKLFVEKINSTKKRLLDWQKIHVRENDLEKFSNIDWVEPEYANSSNCHVFPGSPIIIREDEPSSIIALTLSSRDYLGELSLMRQNVRLSITQSAPVTPTSEPHHPPQISSSFSSLITSLKSSDPVGTNDEYLMMMDQYSSIIKRKLVKDAPGSGLGDKISLGIESLGSMKPFNLSLGSKDKKKDLDAEKQIPPKNNGKFGGIFGQKNGDPEKPKVGSTENEKQENFNEKIRPDGDKKPPETTIYSEKSLNEKQDLNETKFTASPSIFVEGFSWNRKPQKEKDSPHLKLQCKHGKKQFSCTVYYATQFDSLRRRCGIENLCIDSLSRCSSWQVTGGKSASTFFKTKDERLVIKQMVSSWKIGEKEALLKFAPKYFKYMDKPPNTPSVLAKIFGFYTIKIKDTKKNHLIMRMDVLVMEHLFFEKTITRKFDLKGIQERHTKESAQENATLWDGDWVEGGYKSHLLIHSHSKKIIREAILNDTQFLADSNIMDYSLLVGVDDEKKELVAGIVDFIGAYTLYKRIENKGKTIGRNAKEVTVLPPDQYKDRFRDSMNQYFSAVPDKWIKCPNTDDNLTSEEPLSPISPSTPTIYPVTLKLPSVL